MRVPPCSINSHLMDLAGMEATEGREGPQSPARLGVTLSVRRNLILSLLILLYHGSAQLILLLRLKHCILNDILLKILNVIINKLDIILISYLFKLNLTSS